MEFTINKKINDNYITIKMNITKELYNEMLEDITMQLLRDYFNSPLTFCDRTLNYDELQRTIFESLTLQDKVKHIEKLALAKLTPEYLYEKYYSFHLKSY